MAISHDVPTQAPYNHNSNYPPVGDPEKKRFTKGQKALAVAAFLTVGVAGVFGYKALESGAEKGITNALNTDNIATAPAVPGESPEGIVDYSEIDPSTLTVEDFYNDTIFPESERVKWAGAIIEERSTPEVIAQMNSLMALGNRPKLGEIVPASENNSGDEILAQQSLATYIASIDPDHNVGRKLMAASASNDNPGFEASLLQLGAGQDPVTATYIVGKGGVNAPAQETPTFYESAINDYVPNGDPSKFIKIRSTFDNTYSEITVKFIEGRWITVDTISDTDQDWIMSPQEIAVK